jgi:hypothetical protein
MQKSGNCASVFVTIFVVSHAHASVCLRTLDQDVQSFGDNRSGGLQSTAFSCSSHKPNK